MHNYICFYKDRRITVQAPTSLEAQTIAAAKLKRTPRENIKRRDVTVVLADTPVDPASL